MNAAALERDRTLGDARHGLVKAHPDSRPRAAGSAD
jgi:hypothetical protein